MPDAPQGIQPVNRCAHCQPEKDHVGNRAKRIHILIQPAIFTGEAPPLVQADEEREPNREYAEQENQQQRREQENIRHQVFLKRAPAL